MSVKEDFGRYTQNLLGRVGKAVQQAALKVQGDAQRNLPNSDGRGVDTGNLRRSITYEMDGEMEAEVGTNVEYATYVEFGTSRMKPIPYLTPAYEANKQAIDKSIARAVKLAELESAK
jgi:HK97 gp10 family phage protein